MKSFLFFFFFVVHYVSCVSTPEEVRVVHIVTMNHLDVGFDGIDPIIGYAKNVINKYFDDYFPKSIRVSQELRQKPNNTQGLHPEMIYTTHSFLVSLYLNCINLDGIHCPSEQEKEDFRQAVLRGDIRWHAFPFNAEPELGDKELIEFGIQMSHDLNAQFQIPPTTVMSQRDVPGMTRGIIPILLKHGVTGLTVGVNGASSPPGVPQAFIWQDPKDKSEILATWNPGGYGDISLSSCIWDIPELDHALCFEFRSDNKGPPSVHEVESDWDTIHQEFPNATLIASTYDSWFAELNKVRHNLPVIDQEIGDTWIYGPPSDPKRLATVRSIIRERTKCLEEGLCKLDDPRFYNFSRIFIKNIEHTWGLDVKTFLHDWTNWTNSDFHSALGDKNYQRMVESWIEQRLFVTWSLEALESNEVNVDPHPLLGRILTSLAELDKPLTFPLPSNYQMISLANLTINNGPLSIHFNSSNGAIDSLKDLRSNRQWAGDSNLLSYFHYQTESATDYHTFESEYLYCNPKTQCFWALKDFGKFRLTDQQAPHTETNSTLIQSWMHDGEASYEVIMKLKMPIDSYVQFGAPKELYLVYTIFKGLPVINIDLHLLNKTATRIPEAGFFSFNPVAASDAKSWIFKKLGQDVSVDQVCVNGSYHLHGIGNEHDAVRYVDSVYGASMNIQSLDAAVVTPGTSTPFPTPLSMPDLSQGVHFHLFNNIWGTNYVMWYPFLQEDVHTLYRFSISFQ